MITSSIKLFSVLVILASNKIQVSGHCLNNEAFKIFHDGTYRTCQNISVDEDLRQNLCVKEEVTSACPHTCGQCCENSADYRFTRRNGMTAGCLWLKKKKRKSRYCNNTEILFDGGVTVRGGCPKACNSCHHPVSNDVPNDANPVITAFPTISPSPSVALSDSPSSAPTPTPTATDTDITAPSCQNDEDFSFKLTNLWKSVGCSWIISSRNVDVRRRNYCSDSSIAAACPQACGTCCADLESFTFPHNFKFNKAKNSNSNSKSKSNLNKGGKLLKCLWLEKHPSPVLTGLYCNARTNGQLLGYACAKSCDMCV